MTFQEPTCHTRVVRWQSWCCWGSGVCGWSDELYKYSGNYLMAPPPPPPPPAVVTWLVRQDLNILFHRLSCRSNTQTRCFVGSTSCNQVHNGWSYGITPVNEFSLWAQSLHKNHFRKKRMRSPSSPASLTGLVGKNPGGPSPGTTQGYCCHLLHFCSHPSCITQQWTRESDNRHPIIKVTKTQHSINFNYNVGFRTNSSLRSFSSSAVTLSFASWVHMFSSWTLVLSQINWNYSGMFEMYETQK